MYSFVPESFLHAFLTFLRVCERGRLAGLCTWGQVCGASGKSKVSYTGRPACLLHSVMLVAGTSDTKRHWTVFSIIKEWLLVSQCSFNYMYVVALYLK